MAVGISALISAAALILPACAARNLPDPSTAKTALGGPTRFVVEFSSSGSAKFRKRDGSLDTDGFYGKVKQTNTMVAPGQNFTSDLFHGASFDIVNPTNASVDDIKGLPEVENIWPIGIFTIETPKADQPVLSNPDFSAYHPHTLTNVLEAHKLGFDGSDVVVAVVDSGIDYNHPALGGGFGPGFRVEAGWDFVGKDFTPARPNDITPGPDPMDCAGHGTHVSGILGSSWPQLPGVAPKVRLRGYKVFGCEPSTTEDYIIQAFIRAYEEGADIITASLGSSSGYAEALIARLITKITEKGVFVSTAVGNDGDFGPYYTSNTANGYGGLAVGSASVKTQLTYSVAARSSSGKTRIIPFVTSDSKPWERNGIHKAFMPPVPRDFDICGDGFPEDMTVPDDDILVLPRGQALVCSDGWQLMDSELIGVAKWVFYYNFPNRLNEQPNRVVYRDDQPIGFASINYEDGIWLDEQKKANHTVSFDFGSSQSDKDRSAAFTSDFSSWGTTLDARLKPEISAPGDEILSTFVTEAGGWIPLSGTSMATPYIAGVAALFFQSVGGRSKIAGLNPAAVAHRRLVSSGQTIFHSNWTDTIGAIGQQGAGLVDALKVVSYKTSISPAIVQLNDTVNFNGVHTITIQNNGDSPVTYNLTHEAGPTVRSRGLGDAYIDNFPVLRNDQGLAKVELSASAITVPAKGEASFEATFAEPADIDANVLAQYGGYIHIFGSNEEALKVTYIGIKGAIKDAQVWETQNGVPAFYTAENKQFADGTVFPFPTLPNIHFNVLWSSREFSFDVVRADWKPSDWVYPPVPGQNNFVGSTMYFDEMRGQYYPFPRKLFPRQLDIFLMKLGPDYAGGDPVQSGEYRILARALKTYGKFENIEDWQYRLSNVFVVGESEKPASTAAASTTSLLSNATAAITVPATAKSTQTAPSRL